MKSKSFPVLPVEPPGGGRKEFLLAVLAAEGRREWTGGGEGEGERARRGRGGLQRRRAERAEKERKAQLGAGRGRSPLDREEEP